MNFNTLGDLSQFFSLRRYNASLQVDLRNRVLELSSGEVSDVSSHLAGSFTNISGIERSLELNVSFSRVLNSASTFLNGQMQSFEKARGYTADLGVELVKASASEDAVQLSAVLSDAAQKFDSIVSSLNVQIGGRSLFAGNATQSASFKKSSDIVSALTAALATATTSNDVLAIADTWFSSGGGYEGGAYTGSLDALDGFRVGSAETLQPTLSGDSDEIRNLIKFHSLAAVASAGGLQLIPAEMKNLANTLGQGMINLDRDLISKAAEVGSTQERLESLISSNSSESYSLMEARKNLIGVDTAETALRLNETETQLQALYTVTARLSQLSLTEYL